MVCIIVSTILTMVVLEKEKVCLKNKDVYIISFINALLLLFALVYEIPILNILMLIWLSYIAYVDCMTCYVYDCMEYYGVVIALSGISVLFDNDVNNYEKRLFVLVMILIFIAGERAGCYGKGDTDILAVMCVVYQKPLYVTVVFIIAVCLFIIRYIKEFVSGKGKLNRKKPFIPSIYMGNVLILVYSIISSQSCIYVV